MALPIRDPHPIPLRPPAARPHLRLIEGGPDASRRRRQPLAVYRRRRLGALLVAVTALFALLTGAASLERGLTDPPAPAPAATPAVDGEVYVVQPGDTVWSIAERLDPGGDIRPTVDRLAEAAGGAALHPGQRIPLDDVG
jgi:hypothetical protein